MSRRRFWAVALLTIVVMALAPGLALAASGAGPDDAMTPDGTWMSLRPGQSHWYAFQYDGEEGDVAASIEASPADAVHFMIVTAEQAERWRLGQELESCGCGTENDLEAGDLYWTGKFVVPGTYYAVVKHTGERDVAANYALSLTGQGVSFLTEEPAAAAEPAAVVAEPAAAAAAMDDWMPLAVGEEHWMQFAYIGDGSQIYISLDAEPNNGATFSVWTPDEVRRYAQGAEVDPVGRGSEDEFASGDLFWTGSFESAGTYYVRVEHTGSAPSNCKLEITGEGVTF